MSHSASSTPTLDIQGRVATITLRRPELANRLAPEDIATFRSHLEAVNAMPQVLVLQLRGEGRFFCSGYDIASIGNSGVSGFEDLVNAVEDARPVTITVLHGGAYGGATDIALASDFRVGTRAVNMFMPAAKLGLHFYQRGMERYVSRLGIDAAKRLFLTGQRIDAETMLRYGVLTDLVEPEALETTVQSLTDAVSGMAPLAVLGMKKHLNQIAVGRLDLQSLRQAIEQAAASSDLREGTQAWTEKRDPVFTGS